jgi:type IV fimbrial biogenesis protein FimT
MQQVKNVSNARFSVCEKEPFVCSKNRHLIPFVGINIPSSHFYRTIIRTAFVRSRSKGFTLIELVVTMAIAIILVSIAVPSFRTTAQNSRITAHANDFVSDLSLARSEAIRRRSNVVVCTSNTGTSCTAGGNWSAGRVIMSGLNVLRYREPLGATTDSLNDTSGFDSYTFDYHGAVTPGATTFIFCDGRGAAYGKVLSLNAVGQITISKSPPGAC